MLWLIVMLLSIAGAVAGGIQLYRTRGQSRLSLLLVAVAVPLLLVSMTHNEGTTEPPMVTAFDPTQATLEELEQHRHVLATIRELRRRLGEESNHPETWTLLGRKLYAMEDYASAAEAFAKALETGGESADLLMMYAHAVADEEENMTGLPYELALRALALEPGHEDALWFAGGAAYERRDLEQASEYWQRLRERLPAESEPLAVIERNLQVVRAQLDEQDPEQQPHP